MIKRVPGSLKLVVNYALPLRFILCVVGALMAFYHGDLLLTVESIGVIPERVVMHKIMFSRMYCVVGVFYLLVVLVVFCFPDYRKIHLHAR